MKYVENKTDEIYLEALNQNFNVAFSLNLYNRKIAFLVLRVSLQHKDKKILTNIIEIFSKDKKIINFYTKHKLWKYVNFDRIKDLDKYYMVI